MNDDGLTMLRPLQLVCVRHGESAWNKDNKFCGWVDVPLSDNGIKEAHEAGEAIKAQGLVFDTVFTSVLKRAEETANIILQYCDHQPPKILQHWRLNERHYGALTGLNKAQMAEIHGKDQVQIWRRSFDVAPPVMTPDHPYFNQIGKKGKISFELWLGKLTGVLVQKLSHECHKCTILSSVATPY